MITNFVKKQGQIAQLDICVEECAELIHAISKYKRAKGIGYKAESTKEWEKIKLTGAIAQAINAIRGVMLLCDIPPDYIFMETYASDTKALGKKKLESKSMEQWKNENRCLLKLLSKETENV